MLTISHDRYFLDQIADRIVEISDGHGEFYSGNYTFYMAVSYPHLDVYKRQLFSGAGCGAFVVLPF